jgi:cytoplasmic iron level regulating protein YaaA (DUF328/UPF0246 family)
MITIISPAKSLDFNKTIPNGLKFTKAEFTHSSNDLAALLKKLNPAELQNLMGISLKLADLNYERYQQWQEKPQAEITRPALLTFNGEVYNGLDAASLSADDLQYAQNHLRILSGLYGLLRPLDLIQAYRLEMGIKLNNPKGDNLYKYWGSKIAEKIKDDLNKSGSNTLINLASNEYFKSIKPFIKDLNIITPVFKENQNGNWKVITVYAKKARGLMSRFIIQNKINKAEDLKHFDLEGYFYNDPISKGNEIVFTR